MIDQQLPKKERRDLKQQTKQSQTDMRKIKKRTQKIALWGIGVLVIVASGYGLMRLSSEPKAPQLGKQFPIQGQAHIAIGETHLPYNSNPPTSGPHYVDPAKWGVYKQELPDEQLVHNIEHGGIWISYKNIATDTKDRLDSIQKRYPGSVIVTPRVKDDAPILLTSWGHLQELTEYNEELIVSFIRGNTNHSPEPLAN